MVIIDHLFFVYFKKKPIDMLKDLVLKSRSYRRFYQDHKVSYDDLKDLIELARFTPSARNLQPFQYYLSADIETNNKIFSTLTWAGYLKDWDGPAEGERPAAYIVIVGNRRLTQNFFCDHGIVAQTILLGAVEKDLGGCILAYINKQELKDLLNIERHFEVLLVIAIGKPKEQIVLEDVKEGNIKYYRDENGVHHVPKRSLDDLLL